MPIHVRIGKETQDDWNAMCAEMGTTSSDEIRAFIKSRLSRRQHPVKIAMQRSKQDKIRQTLFLTVGEIEALKKWQEREGGSRASLIIKFIRAGLTRQPVFDQAEVDALLTNNAELSRIGSNLNQIARQLNQGLNMEEIQQALDIESVKKAIDENRAGVHELVSFNLKRWDFSE